MAAKMFHGQVYKLCNDVDDRYYVGSTQQSLNQRFLCHKYRAEKGLQSRLYRSMRNVGISRWKIELIEKVECENLKTLFVHENNHIHLKDPMCLNTMKPMGIWRDEFEAPNQYKERYHQYYIDRKNQPGKHETDVQKQKEYRQNDRAENPEKYTKKNQISWINHKEKMENNPEYEAQHREKQKEKYASRKDKEEVQEKQKENQKRYRNVVKNDPEKLERAKQVRQTRYLRHKEKMENDPSYAISFREKVQEQAEKRKKNPKIDLARHLDAGIP